MNANQRRKLRFNSIDECRAEVERILAADAQGLLTTLGRWTAGEILTHLAAWINYGYDGFPMRPVPFFVQWFLKRSLKKVFRDGMQPGIRIPGVAGGTSGMEDIPTAEAGARFLNAVERLASDETAPHDSPAFGKFSDAERRLLNLRHAELHLSFLSYPNAPN